MGDSDQVIFTGGEFYEKHLDSKEYLKFYDLDPSSCDGRLPFALRHLNEIFSSGNVKGKRLIDIGSGPTIHVIISASKCFEEIVLSNFTKGNRREIEKWLKNEKGCFDWRPIIRFVCELEGRRCPVRIVLFTNQKTNVERSATRIETEQFAGNCRMKLARPYTNHRPRSPNSLYGPQSVGFTGRAETLQDCGGKAFSVQLAKVRQSNIAI